MERAALEAIRAADVQAPTADLSSLAPWRCQDSPPAPETPDDVLGGEVPRGAEGDAGQSGQEDRRSGRRESAHAPATASACPRVASPPQGAARPPRLDSQARHDGTAPARHPDHAGPGGAGAR